VSEAVIVAHGLWFPGVETKLLRIRLEKAGFEAYLFRFPTLRGSLEQNVQKLGRFAEGIPCSRLHFVGFSLGGVVTLRMLSATRANHVGRVVCLGSPLTGSQVASRLGGTELGRRVVGRSLREHIDLGGIANWERNIEVGIIAGTRSMGVGRLVDALPGASDGTVAVEETRLPGAKAHMTLPVTHTQLLFDAAVARQTISFLRNGRFL
jgi:pimeloyl-ACP methyl ester carboxylesterase